MLRLKDLRVSPVCPGRLSRRHVAVTIHELVAAAFVECSFFDERPDRAKRNRETVHFKESP